MDKREYQEKLQEINRLIADENYEGAARVADSIDWKRVRNVQTLVMISEIYEAVERYEDSKTLLLRAYRRSPVGRTVLYRLVECTIKLRQFDQAIEYYSEYVQAAPHDNNKYILKYKIYRARGSSLDEQIDILKDYLDQEYNEKWAYELARLQCQADRVQEGLATCDDLVLWFHSGKYVIKALELKKKYAPLTPKQQEIYDNRFEEEEDEVEELAPASYLNQASNMAKAERAAAEQEEIKSELAADISHTAKMEATKEEISRKAEEAQAEVERKAAESEKALVQKTKVLVPKEKESAGTEASEFAGSETKILIPKEKESAGTEASGFAGSETKILIPKAKESAGSAADQAVTGAEKETPAAEDIMTLTSQAVDTAAQTTAEKSETVDTAAQTTAEKSETVDAAAQTVIQRITPTAQTFMSDMQAAEPEVQSAAVTEEPKVQDTAATAESEVQDTAATAETQVQEMTAVSSVPPMKAVSSAVEAMIEITEEAEQEGDLPESAVSETVTEIAAEETTAVETAAAEVMAEETAAAEIMAEETVAVEEAAEDAGDISDQVDDRSPEQRQADMVRSMREIVSGVGPKDQMEMDEAVLEETIDQSKEDQENAVAARGADMTFRVPVSEAAQKRTAGRLTIDDILLSMGDGGDHVREVTGGSVMSATEEAQMTARHEESSAPVPEEDKDPEIPRFLREDVREAKQTEELPVTEIARADDAMRAARELEDGVAEQEMAPESAGTSQDAAREAAALVGASRVEYTKEIAEAKTRRLPVEEIRKLHAAYLSENAGVEDETDAHAAHTLDEALGQVSPASDRTANDVDETARTASVAAAGTATMEALTADGADGQASPAADESMRFGSEAAEEAARNAAQAAEEAARNAAQAAEKAAEMAEAEAADIRLEADDEDEDIKIAGAPGQSHLDRSEPARMDQDLDMMGSDTVDEFGAAMPETVSEPAPDDGIDASAVDAINERIGEQVTREVPKSEPEPQVLSGRAYLKDSQMELFRGFTSIGSLPEQIAGAIWQAEHRKDERTSRSGNILILGAHGCGKTTIATGIAKAIAEDKGTHSVKMARIYAADLNRKDIAATIAKIAGGVLIVEEAGDLDDAIVDQLTTAMEFRTDGLIMILEDEQRYIHDLLMRHPRFTMKFTAQIYIPEYSAEDLVNFGEIYAQSQDYVFSEKAVDACMNKIEAARKSGEAVSVTNVIELVDRAIKNANTFFRRIGSAKKRYDDQDRVILQEKDFR